MRFRPIERFKLVDSPWHQAFIRRTARRRALQAGDGRADRAVDMLLSTRARAHAEMMRADRNKRAADWRRARARLAGYDAGIRSTLRAYWNEEYGLPADPRYLLDMLNIYDAGVLRLDRLASATKLSLRSIDYRSLRSKCTVQPGA